MKLVTGNPRSKSSFQTNNQQHIMMRKGVGWSDNRSLLQLLALARLNTMSDGSDAYMIRSRSIKGTTQKQTSPTICTFQGRIPCLIDKIDT